MLRYWITLIFVKAIARAEYIQAVLGKFVRAVAGWWRRAQVALANPRTARLAVAIFWVVVLAITMPQTALADDGGGTLLGAARDIAKKVIDLLIGIAALLLAVGIATGFVQGQFETMVGRPMGLANAWVRVAAVVICAAGAFLSVMAANMVIDILAGYTSSDIHLPGGGSSGQ